MRNICNVCQVENKVLNWFRTAQVWWTGLKGCFLLPPCFSVPRVSLVPLFGQIHSLTPTALLAHIGVFKPASTPGARLTLKPEEEDPFINCFPLCSRSPYTAPAKHLRKGSTRNILLAVPPLILPLFTADRPQCCVCRKLKHAPGRVSQTHTKRFSVVSSTAGLVRH